MGSPIKTFKCGGVSAAIFKNTIEHEGKTFDTHNVQIQRTYKDKDGSFQHTSSFRETDLPKVALVAQKAYEHLTMAQANEEVSMDQ